MVGRLTRHTLSWGGKLWKCGNQIFGDMTIVKGKRYTSMITGKIRSTLRWRGEPT
jgi:hypothetical protein